MNLREMRRQLGDTQSEFAARYGIPFRTIQNWEAGVRTPPAYLLAMLEDRVKSDLINRKTIFSPKYSYRNKNLPNRREYVGPLEWLRAVRERIGEDVVFALDEALMCQENFLGRYGEHIVWVYGSDSLLRFNGIAILGNSIDPRDVEEKDGLRYTSFNRTVVDALANENILDMQGITEALSNYYYENGESFEKIFIPPEYQKGFTSIAQNAIEYYDS